MGLTEYAEVEFLMIMFQNMEGEDASVLLKDSHTPYEVIDL